LLGIKGEPGTQLPFDNRRLPMGVRSRLAELLGAAPADAGAVEFERAWWTWGMVQATAGSLDAVLAGLGLGAGARVGVVLENRPEHVAVVVGLLASGRCVVTLSPLQPADRLAADIARCEPSVVIGSPEVLGRDGVAAAAAAAGLAVELAGDGALRVLAGEVPPSPLVLPGVAIEMLTSGTTGPPKRVRLSDDQFDQALVSGGGPLRPGVLLRTGVSIAATPMVHIGGMWAVVSSLYAGRRVVLLARFQLEPWVSAVERHRPRAAALVPAALRTVLDAGVPAERLSSLDVVTSGTTYCPPELADAFHDRYGIPVLMTYGATEFAGALAVWTLPMHQQWWKAKRGSAGRAVPGVAMRVVDAAGRPAGPRDVGHLEIRTAQSPQGGDEWVRTSDLARIDEDGFLFIAGRADDAIIRGGFKVQPEQVRMALERHPAVGEAAVVALPDDRLGQVPAAAVELRPGVPVPDPAELIAACREQLTPYEVPVHIAILDALPRTASSKVSRVDLVELVQASLARKGAQGVA
jgi:acyl-CoA synthetase (AMP-forming)/AMP-acid ligase II